jgi:hypothetical protein
LLPTSAATLLRIENSAEESPLAGDSATIIVGMRKEEHVRGNLALSDAGSLDAALLAKMKRHRWDRSPAPWSD